MAHVIALSKCPHCGARGTRKNDVRVLDGFEMNFPYCGRCGKNVPDEADRKPAQPIPFEKRTE